MNHNQKTHSHHRYQTLAVVGCGPKGISIASKAAVLQQMGFGGCRVVLIEQHMVAANWNGTHGYTDGMQILANPPEKDIGFPYRSLFGAAIDRAMQDLSWSTFLIENGKYSDWVDRGRVQPRHSEFAAYLQWVTRQVKPDIYYAELIALQPRDQQLALTLRQNTGISETIVDGVVFTGPGEPKRIPGSQHTWTDNIFNGKNFWQHQTVFAQARNCKVAVIGTGETSASVLTALLLQYPGLDISLISRSPTAYTRSENHLENRIFTNPEQWHELDFTERERFIQRTDRGVMSALAKALLDQYHISLVTGNVVDLHDDGTAVQVTIQRAKRTEQLIYDKVIVAIGFDALSPLKLIPEQFCFLTELENIHYHIDYHLRIPWHRLSSPDQATSVNIHMPMLAGPAQGPGFPNLSCLGLMADRVLSTYCAG